MVFGFIGAIRVYINNSFFRPIESVIGKLIGLIMYISYCKEES